MGKKVKDPFMFIKNGNNGVYRSTTLAVMFFDIIGFTKDTTNEAMKDCIRSIEAAIADELWDNYNWNEENEKNDLILIPTGDGYSFAFHPQFSNDEVLEIVKKFYCRLIKKLRNINDFKIRMGVAKGPCQVYRDQNEKNNVFGYGINLANRVMGLARENQILVHEDFAKDILRQREHTELHDLSGKQFVIKHGESLRVYNFYGLHEGMSFGNKEDPEDPITMTQEGD